MKRSRDESLENGPQPGQPGYRKWAKKVAVLGKGAKSLPVVIIKGEGVHEDEKIVIENLHARAVARSQKGGKYEECWICGSTDHRRSECPNAMQRKGEMDKRIQAKLVCLGCRKVGHIVKDCPEKGSNYAKSICFNCGESSHSLRDCPQPRKGSSLPFASCFVCNEKGHLASACPKNKDRGVFPKGGACLRCGSTAHLAINCDKYGHGEGNAAPKNRNRGYSSGVGSDAAPKSSTLSFGQAAVTKSTGKHFKFGGDDLDGNFATD